MKRIEIEQWVQQLEGVADVELVDAMAQERRVIIMTIDGSDLESWRPHVELFWECVLNQLPEHKLLEVNVEYLQDGFRLNMVCDPPLVLRAFYLEMESMAFEDDLKETEKYWSLVEEGFRKAFQRCSIPVSDEFRIFGTSDVDDDYSRHIDPPRSSET